MTTPRQSYAMANPLNGGAQDIEPYRLIEPQPDGNMLVTILAVDR